MDPQTTLKPLLGQTLVSVEGAHEGSNEIVFTPETEAKRWRMFHRRDCCENVDVESVKGELENLLGSPVLSAAEEIESGDENYGTFTRTTFTITTAKGTVKIVWLGQSNGYYSEGVDFQTC